MGKSKSDKSGEGEGSNQVIRRDEEARSMDGEHSRGEKLMAGVSRSGRTNVDGGSRASHKGWGRCRGAIVGGLVSDKGAVASVGRQSETAPQAVSKYAGPPPRPPLHRGSRPSSKRISAVRKPNA